MWKWIKQNPHLVLVAIMAIILISITQLNQAKEASYRPAQNNTYAQTQTTQAHKSKMGLQIKNRFSANPCAKIKNTEKSQYTDCLKEEDHKSQSYMKSAAWWQLLATMAGLLLIWRTLEHSKNAAVAAKDTVDVAKAQLKASLRVKSCKLKQDGLALKVSVSYENVGQSMAKSVMSHAVLSLHESSATFPKLFN